MPNRVREAVHIDQTGEYHLAWTRRINGFPYPVMRKEHLSISPRAEVFGHWSRILLKVSLEVSCSGGFSIARITSQLGTPWR